MRILPKRLRLFLLGTTLFCFSHGPAGAQFQPSPPHPTIREISGPTMGTTYSVKIVNLPHGAEAELGGKIEQLLNDLNQKMSTYLPDSELMRFNAVTTTEWVPVSRDLYDVLREGLLWSRKTQGAFDVSVGALVNLWGFGPQPARFAIPPPSQIEEARRKVGYQYLHLSESSRSIKKERPGLFLDLSAIAKGYAVDRLVELLKSRGWDRCLVEIGGELKGLGLNQRGEKWSVGIQDPSGSGSHLDLSISGEAVATSGDYRHFMLRNGHRYSHILDPRSGRPIENHLASVSVVHDSAMTADALATALMILGPVASYNLALQEQLAVIFLVRRGDRFEIRMTPKAKLHAKRTGGPIQ